MKLVLQVALGVLLAIGAIAGTLCSDNWYENRSTANKYDRAAFSELSGTVAHYWTFSTREGCATAVRQLQQSRKDFHLNWADCAELMEKSVEKEKADMEAKKAKL